MYRTEMLLLMLVVDCGHFNDNDSSSSIDIDIDCWPYVAKVLAFSIFF